MSHNHLDLWDAHERELDMPSPDMVAATLERTAERLNAAREWLKRAVKDLEDVREMEAGVYHGARKALMEIDTARACVSAAMSGRKTK